MDRGVRIPGLFHIYPCYGRLGGGKITYTELKEKYGESVINRLVTDIVITGMREAGAEGPRTPFGMIIGQCLEDLRASDWNDIRSTIKRSL